MALCGDDHKKLADRISRVEGQVRGLKKLVQEDRDCFEVLKQIAAASGACTRISYDRGIHSPGEDRGDATIKTVMACAESPVIHQANPAQISIVGVSHVAYRSIDFADRGL